MVCRSGLTPTPPARDGAHKLDPGEYMFIGSCPRKHQITILNYGRAGDDIPGEAASVMVTVPDAGADPSGDRVVAPRDAPPGQRRVS